MFKKISTIALAALLACVLLTAAMAEGTVIELDPMYNVPTEELITRFPIKYETPAVTDMEKKIQNRMLNGFNTWNLGYDAWEHWGEVLYSDASIYNVHGAHLTLKEYQASMNMALQATDIQMGQFLNMILSGDWTAIRYETSMTNRETGETTYSPVTEFVRFKDFGEKGAKVDEGWGGVRDASMAGMMYFMTEEEQAYQKELDDAILSIVLPDTDDLEAKYPVTYEVLEANDGEEVLTLLGGNSADLIISDLMMPKMDGYEMVAALRQMHTNIPILLITAKDSFLDLQKGFLTGADDYMTKPININEMVLRVQALLRRSQMNAEQRCVIGTTTLDYNAFSVICGSKEQLLPQKEFLLLFKLLSNPGKAFTRLQLMDDVWGYDTETDPHTVDVHIARLRNRFMDNPDFEIQTIRGMGYRAVKKG